MKAVFLWQSICRTHFAYWTIFSK